MAITTNVLRWQEGLQIGQIANLFLTNRASRDIIVVIGVCNSNSPMRGIVHVFADREGSVVVQVHEYTSDGNCHFVKGDW